MPHILIIGAGLAGLTAALKLSRQDRAVTVLEKKNLPRHKVCGEYLSYEVIPYLKNAGIDLTDRPRVDEFVLSVPSGKYLEHHLPLGGVGISRKSLDAKLCEKAREAGASVHFQSKVEDVYFSDGHFHIHTSKDQQYTADVVIASHGKGPGWKTYSDLKKNAQHTYLAAKQYYRYDLPENRVVLHNFKGGYCGAVKVEDNTIDVAYMVRQDVFRQFKNPSRMEEELLHSNPFLEELMTEGNPVMEQPQMISNIQLGPRALVRNHILHAGDAAAMAAPLTGNGMAMAIWGGRQAAIATERFLQDEINRSAMEQQYRNAWNARMRSRLYWGRQFQRIMDTKWAAEAAIEILKVFPGLLPRLIEWTHGTSNTRKSLE